MTSPIAPYRSSAWNGSRSSAARRHAADPLATIEPGTSLRHHPSRIAYPRAPREHRRRKPGRPMRPNLLNPLFAAVTTLSGVGPRLEKLYRRLVGREDVARVVDLLFHLPTGTIDRRARAKLADVTPDTVVTVAVTVDRHGA